MRLTIYLMLVALVLFTGTLVTFFVPQIVSFILDKVSGELLTLDDKIVMKVLITKAIYLSSRSFQMEGVGVESYRRTFGASTSIFSPANHPNMVSNENWHLYLPIKSLKTIQYFVHFL